MKGVPGFYILAGKTPVAVANVAEWAAWRALDDGNGSHIVGRYERDGVTVSTVFLGLDHAFGGGPPLLFETMVFGGPDDGAQWRFATWDEAEAHHMATCRTLRTAHPSS